MESVCIRVKFSALMKNISKDNSKCSLEIIPLVTRTENIDKIKWKQKKDEIEYIVPMNYKLIIKKLKPNTDAIKKYYSCVDLILSSMPNADVDDGNNIYKIISDNNIILNKEINNFMALSNLPSIDNKWNQKIHRNRLEATNPNEKCNLSTMLLNLSDSMLSNDKSNKKIETGSSQTEKDEEAVILLSQDHRNVTHNVGKCTTNTMIQTDEVNYCKAKTCKHNIMLKNYCKRKFMMTYFNAPLLKKIKSMHNDDISVFGNFRINKQYNFSIPRMINNQDLSKYYNSKNTRIEDTEKSFPLHKIHDSFDEEMMFITNIRIQPELRVAKFVEKMEKEIMPLKIILNNIISKFSTLGLKYVDNEFTSYPLFNTNLNFSSIQVMKQRERYFNRVVMSVVFDK